MRKTIFLLTSFIVMLPYTIVTSFYNVYSPDVVHQGSGMVMYFGGWLSQSDVPTDSIYRCSMPCYSPVKVVSPVTPVVQVNDPSMVYMPGGYWIMYMTGSTSLLGELSAQGIYYATSWAGDIWSPPQFLMSGYWLPSAVLKNGHVYLYANSTLNGLLYQFDLGTSGVAVGSPIQLSMPETGYSWANIDVDYHQSINMWQMVAENLDGNGTSSTFVDYLYSQNGITWMMGQSHIIQAQAGGSIRTPALHPDTAYYVYHGCSVTRDGMANQICFTDWSP